MKLNKYYATEEWIAYFAEWSKHPEMPNYIKHTKDEKKFIKLINFFNRRTKTQIIFINLTSNKLYNTLTKPSPTNNLISLLK